MNQLPIQVLIVDDHAIVRKGIRALLAEVDCIQVVGEAGNGQPADLLQAIQQVHRGEPSLHPIIASKVLQEMQRPSRRPPTPDPLTDRELQVLRLVAKGLGNQEIAEQLVVTEATVRSHVSNILHKLHLANRVQATLYALQEGLTSLGGEPEM
jgi:NarL family two-component system response regulator LiaR